jgi:hypothetical protein
VSTTTVRHHHLSAVPPTFFSRTWKIASQPTLQTRRGVVRGRARSNLVEWSPRESLLLNDAFLPLFGVADDAYSQDGIEELNCGSIVR